jgi:hypothetical protein
MTKAQKLVFLPLLQVLMSFVGGARPVMAADLQVREPSDNAYLTVISVAHAGEEGSRPIGRPCAVTGVRG